MKSSIAMKTFVTQIAQKHGLDLTSDSTHLRLNMPLMGRLVIEKLDKHRLGVARYQEYKDVLFAEPEIVFYITGDDEWLPIAETWPISGHDIYVELDLNGKLITCIDPVNQQKLATLSDDWADNLKNQEWLDRGHCRLLVTPNSEYRFPLGDLCVTPAARTALNRVGQSQFDWLARHQAGDWGILSEADKQENDYRVHRYFKLCSAYQLDDNTTLWVITDSDRNSTTVMLPTEEWVPTTQEGQPGVYQR